MSAPHGRVQDPESIPSPHYRVSLSRLFLSALLDALGARVEGALALGLVGQILASLLLCLGRETSR